MTLALRPFVQAVEKMNVPVRKGKVHFMEVLMSLLDRMAGVSRDIRSDAPHVHGRLSLRFPKKMPSLLTLPPITGWTSEERFANIVANNTVNPPLKQQQSNSKGFRTPPPADSDSTAGSVAGSATPGSVTPVAENTPRRSVWIDQSVV